MANDIQQGALNLTGNPALIATLSAWHPFVDVYVDKSTDPNLMGSRWIVKAVSTTGGHTTRTTVTQGIVTFNDAPNSGQRVIGKYPVPPCDSIELWAAAPNASSPTVAALRGAICGWDPASAVAEASTTAHSAGLASGTPETALGTVAWNPSVSLYCQAGAQALGMAIFMRAVLPGPFVAKPLVGSATFGDVEPSRLVCSAEGYASSWQMSAAAIAGDTGIFDMTIAASATPGESPGATGPDGPPGPAGPGGNVFVYDADAVSPASPIFDTFAGAYAAAHATGYPCTIVIAQTATNLAEVLAGTFDLSMIELRGGQPPRDINNGPNVTLHWRANARIANGWYQSTNLRHVIDDSGAFSDHVWAIGTGTFADTIFDNTTVQSDVGNTNRSLVDVTGDGQFNLALRGQSRILAAFGTQTTFIQTFNTAQVNVEVEDGAIIDTATMARADSGTSQINVTLVSPGAICTLTNNGGANGVNVTARYSNPGNVFTYKAGSLTDVQAQIYGTFQEAFDAAPLVELCTIVIDDNNGAGTCEVLAGSYDLTNVTLQGCRPPTDDVDIGPSVKLHWRADARIVNGWQGSTNLAHVVNDSGALSDRVWEIGTGQVGRTIFDNTYVQADPDNTNRTMIDTTGSGQLVLEMRGRSRLFIAPGTFINQVMIAAGTSQMSVYMEDSALIDTAAIVPTDTAQVKVTSLSPAARCDLIPGPQVTIDLTANADQTAYSPGNSANWAGDPTMDQEAIDRLAAAVAGLLGHAIP